MNAAMFVPLAALALLPLCAVPVLWRVYRLKIGIGPREYRFPRQKRFQFLGVLLCSPILIALCFFRSRDLLTIIALSLTGTLGFYISLADIMFARLGGIYERGLVWNGAILRFDCMKGFVRPDATSVLVRMRSGEQKLIVPDSPQMLERLLSALAASSSPLP